MQVAKRLFLPVGPTINLHHQQESILRWQGAAGFPIFPRHGKRLLSQLKRSTNVAFPATTRVNVAQIIASSSISEKCFIQIGSEHTPVVYALGPGRSRWYHPNPSHPSDPQHHSPSSYPTCPGHQKRLSMDFWIHWLKEPNITWNQTTWICNTVRNGHDWQH